MRNMLGGLLPWLLGVALIVIVLTRAEARSSRLVRAGAIVLAIAFGLLELVPSLLTMLLFFFMAPFAVLLILAGTILSFVKKRTQPDTGTRAARDGEDILK
jgi:uncharacterized membrane protein YedE/YeeE